MAVISSKNLVCIELLGKKTGFVMMQGQDEPIIFHFRW
jgi:hypothetical protein